MNIKDIKEVIEANAKVNNLPYKPTEIERVIPVGAAKVFYAHTWHKRYAQTNLSLAQAAYEVALPADYHSLANAHIFVTGAQGQDVKIIDKDEFNRLYANYKKVAQSEPCYAEIIYKKAAKLSYLVFECPANTNYNVSIGYYTRYIDLNDMDDALLPAVVTATLQQLAKPGSKEYWSLETQLVNADIPAAVEADQMDNAAPTVMDATRYTGGRSPFSMNETGD